nr:MAG: putative non-structural protein [Phoenicurus auroreus ambidensovirus]
MVSVPVNNRYSNCTSLLQQQEHGSHKNYSEKNHCVRRLNFDTAGNSEEETIHVKTKSEHDGVFFGKSKKTKHSSARENSTVCNGTSRFFGEFGRRRKSGGRGTRTDTPYASSRSERYDVSSVGKNSASVRDVLHFFRGNVGAQRSRQQRLPAAVGVFDVVDEFTTIPEPTDESRLLRKHYQSQTMETDHTVESSANADRVDSDITERGDRRKPMVTMAKNDEECVQSFADELRNVAREMFVRYLGSTQKYVSDICVPENGEELTRFINELRELSRTAVTDQFRVVSVHGTHVHVIHACAYSNATCRCSWLGGSAVWRARKRIRYRRRVFLADLSVRDWEGILGYLITNGHTIQSLESRSFNGRLCVRLTNLQKRGHTPVGVNKMVYPCPYEVHGNGSGEPSDQSETGFHSGRSDGGHQKQEERAGNQELRVWPKTLDELLVKFPCCPPDAFFNVKEFYNNPNLNYLDDNAKTVRVCLRNWCARIREWSVYDFNNYYSSGTVVPYFNAYARDKKQVYYDVDTSLEIAEKLLFYQFENDETLILNFLKDLYEVVDKIVPKKNSMCILSPPSAGKNFFFDAIAAYFLNYGMFGTANKTNQFSWADGAGKRLVLWNEPNYETFHVEKIKELLGGDTTRIHVKYKGDQPLQGPPVILLTNNSLNICSDAAFADRLVTYEWKSAPFLKQYDRKLNPLFFFKLLDKWILNK